MPPTPVAEGTLAQTPFAHVLLSILRRKLAGTLAVWPDDERGGQDRIRFLNGAPIAGRLLDPAESLERGMLPIFRRTVAPYAFYEADLVGSGVGVIEAPCETLALIAAALRGGGREDVVANVLHEFETIRVRIVTGFDAAPFRLVPKELAFLDLVRAEPDFLPALIERSGDEKVARRVLYLLAITKNLERMRAPSAVTSWEGPPLQPLRGDPSMKFAVSALGAPPTEATAPAPAPSAARSPGSSASAPRPERRKPRGFDAPDPPPPPPPELSAEHLSKWVALTDRIVASDTQTYFDLLGIADTSVGEAARAAYFDAVKKVHPDRLPAELAPLRPYVEKLFQQITEAKETLENEEQRVKYVRIARDGGGTPAADRKMMAVLAAAHELEKANVLANLGKWDDVLNALDDAKALDPSQTDIYALEAWAYFHLLGTNPAATVEGILMLTERVLANSKDGYHERALFTRGLALKKQNKNEQAVALFKRIAEHNPRNLDAAREVRLFEMRQRDGAKGPDAGGAGTKDSGLFSKFFGGKK